MLDVTFYHVVGSLVALTRGTFYMDCLTINWHCLWRWISGLLYTGKQHECGWTLNCDERIDKYVHFKGELPYQN